MAIEQNLSNRINENYKKMSKGQKKLATYITENYDKAAFLTAAELGKKVGVSESTVVRFATSLHYKGYPEFQKELAEQVRNKLSNAQRTEQDYASFTKSKVLNTMIKADIERLKKTNNQIDETVFDVAVNVILNAKKVYIVGLRACSPLAEYFAFYLRMVRDDVVLLKSTSEQEIFEQMLRISGKDCLIGISFPRYSIRTLKAMEFANNRSAKVISITDSVHSPMNLYSSCNLVACCDTSSIVESMVAPMSVINALIVAMGTIRHKEVMKNIDTLENIWENYQVSGNDELEYMNDVLRMKYTSLGDIDE